MKASVWDEARKVVIPVSDLLTCSSLVERLTLDQLVVGSNPTMTRKGYSKSSRRGDFGRISCKREFLSSWATRLEVLPLRLVHTCFVNIGHWESTALDSAVSEWVTWLKTISPLTVVRYAVR